MSVSSTFPLLAWTAMIGGCAAAAVSVNLGADSLIGPAGSGMASVLLGLGLLGVRQRETRRRVLLALAAARAERDGLAAEKDALLRDAHRQVKNHLRIIATLLNLEAIHGHDDVRRSHANSHGRIEAMALVHQLLYQSGEFATVDAGHYIERLCKALVSSAKHVSLTLDTEPVGLELERIVPLAMLVNELIRNALFHAFPGQCAGRIAVQLHRDGPRLRLVVADDGVGLPAGFDPMHARTLGSKLIASLSRQLNGEVAFESGGGTVVTVVMEG
ncbi:MAG: sensor histidine kinase [Rhodospirillales bacterium]|nr:sensor histidine kinase [Rhodospirillales bacterium]